MSDLTLDDFPFNEWREHDTARCECGSRVELRRYLRAKDIGTFSLAGAGMKFSCVTEWEYRCISCGKTGKAALK